MRRAVAVSAVLLLTLAVAGWWRGWLVPERSAGEQAPGPLTAAALRGQPEVVAVAVTDEQASPTVRIVHLLDWHYVPPDLFGREGHAEHVRDVEGVQQEQVTLLRRLARDHGLKQVFVEGLTPEGVKAYRVKAEVVLAAEEEDMPGLASQLGQARQLLAEMRAKGRADGDNHAQALTIERETLALIDQHRRTVVELGAPGRLLAEGVLAAVLPLDDTGTLDAAAPRKAGGKLLLPPEKNRQREAAMVKRLLAGGPVACCVLGGGHDLTAEVRRQGGGRVEYLRVSTHAYRATAARER